MYIPASFAERDLHTLHDFIEKHSFGVLISPGDELIASHLPFLLDRNSGSRGKLIGHMARANRQWETTENAAVLAIFSGPHAYISPTWYAAENVVPTWNYVAVHVYGTFRRVEDPAATLQIVRAMTERYERSMPQPWILQGNPEFLDRMVAQIVGFEIEIEQIEGKWKLSQNHPQERQERVIRGLLATEYPESAAVARLMQERIAAQ